MILKRLRLRNFRSYDELDLSFDDGITIIDGPNAAGKSNLAEAIHYLSLARSWRTSDDALLLKEKTGSAFIEAEIVEGELHRNIEIELEKSAKRIRVNSKPIRRLSELSRVANVIVFSPSDVPLFLGSPGERRNFLDLSLSKQSSDYFSLIGRYGKLLKERNALLKEASPNLALLDVLTTQLIEAALPIVNYRQMFVSSLNSVLPDILKTLMGKEDVDAHIVYKPFVRNDEKAKERAIDAFKNARQSELMHRATGIGPHREDIAFLLEGKDLAEFGSRGQNRMAVLALKVAPYFLIESEAKKPICVLDDAVSELDQQHIENLISLMKKLGQVFVTTTELDIEGASYIDVSANKAIIRRN